MSIDQYLAFESLSFLILALFVVAGIVGLVVGGDILTKGSVQLAKAFSISPVVIGLTIISIATSMPEMVASMVSASRGNGGLAVGNILGSNLANGGLIVGLCALVSPIVIASRLIKLEVPFLIAVTGLFYFLSRGGELTRGEGFVLVGLTIGYLIFLVKTSKSGDDVLNEEISEEISQETFPAWKSVLYIFLGALGLAVGADFLVSASVESASRLGVSDFIIGITVVAVGTSLPELAACFSAALHKQADLVAGNVIGSNIFNLLLIGGVSSSCYSLPIAPSQMHFELPVLLGMSVLLFWFFFTKAKVGRWEGLVLLLAYIGIMIFSVRSGA